MLEKEEFEWMHSWCDNADKNDLPRVLLIGDSITYGYQEGVRNRLKDSFYVDYLSTSYCADREVLYYIVKSFVEDSNYDIIHFNNGLHGRDCDENAYNDGYKKLLTLFNGKKIVLATSTCVYEQGNEVLDSKWAQRLEQRNSEVLRLAKEKGFAIDDLYTASVNIKKEFRAEDGVHYNSYGYEYLADFVKDSIEKVYNK